MKFNNLLLAQSKPSITVEDKLFISANKEKLSDK
jgi:hypothetical protein